MKRFLLVSFIIVSGIAVYLGFATKPKTMIDDALYPETTYASDSGCKQQNGSSPTATLTGDFDGDHKTDYARLVKQDSSKEAFLVWLTSQDTKPMQLDASETSGTVSISVANAGETIESACKRGYVDECSADEPQEIKLTTDGIWYTLCESAASVFYWNLTRKSFDRIWYSD